MVTASPKLVPSESVVYAQLDNEAVLLNIESGMYFGLDQVGTWVWQLLSQGSTSDEIVDSLLEEYDVTAETLRADIAAWLDELTAKGLVRPTTP